MQTLGLLQFFLPNQCDRFLWTPVDTAVTHGALSGSCDFILSQCQIVHGTCGGAFAAFDAILFMNFQFVGKVPSHIVEPKSLSK